MGMRRVNENEKPLRLDRLTDGIEIFSLIEIENKGAEFRYGC
jgi:hypothetical protein